MLHLPWKLGISCWKNFWVSSFNSTQRFSPPLGWEASEHRSKGPWGVRGKDPGIVAVSTAPRPLLALVYHIPPWEEVARECEVSIIKQLVAWGLIYYRCQPGKTSQGIRLHPLQTALDSHLWPGKRAPIYLLSVPLHLDSVQSPSKIPIKSWKMKLLSTFPTLIHATPLSSTVFQPHWHGWQKGMFMKSSEPGTDFSGTAYW